MAKAPILTADETAKRRHEAPEVGKAAARFMRALAKRAANGESEAIEWLIQLQAELDAATQLAVDNYRELGFSWADVGRLTGTTRQAAQMRFGTKAPKAPAQPGPDLLTLVAERHNPSAAVAERHGATVRSRLS